MTEEISLLHTSPLTEHYFYLKAQTPGGLGKVRRSLCARRGAFPEEGDGDKSAQRVISLSRGSSLREVHLRSQASRPDTLLRGPGGAETKLTVIN